ncbi:MAG TPA: hypothetical protein VH722_07095 [Alphaproteobacteria bacterium]|jgi:hypothetical protein|nr:hypothetical protein [Alphaproteobacteria bacterium]
MSPEPTSLSSAAAVKSSLSQAEIDVLDIAMLSELAEITMGVARAIGKLAVERAEAGEADQAAKLGAVVTKVGRAVRQSVAFRRKIEGEVRARNEASAGAEAVAQEEARQNAAYWRRSRSTARRKMIERGVCRAIAEAGEETGLYDDMHERLLEYESFTDFTDKPVSQFILEIADAMALDLNWEWFAYDPWAAEEIAADPPVSPLAKWWHSPDREDRDDQTPLGGEEPYAQGHGPPLAAE